MPRSYAPKDAPPPLAAFSIIPYGVRRRCAPQCPGPFGPGRNGLFTQRRRRGALGSCPRPTTPTNVLLGSPGPPTLCLSRCPACGRARSFPRPPRGSPRTPRSAPGRVPRLPRRRHSAKRSIGDSAKVLIPVPPSAGSFVSSLRMIDTCCTQERMISGIRPLFTNDVEQEFSEVYRRKSQMAAATP